MCTPQITNSNPKIVKSTILSFSSCQRNLIKSFQIKAMIALITKMALRECSGSFEDVSSNTIIFLRNSCGIPQKQMTVLLDTSSKDPLHSLSADPKIFSKKF